MVKALNDREWKFEEHANELYIISGYQGEDIPVRFMIRVDAEHEVVQFVSPMPFDISEEQRINVAVAVCVANYGLVNGSFDFDINDGELRFRLTTSYCDCQIGDGFFMDMIATAVNTIDRYNDRFMMLSKGEMSLPEFIERDAE